MVSKLRVGLAGVGTGRKHAEALHRLSEQYELVTVCAAHLERAQAMADEYSVPEVSPTLDHMARRDDLDVIVLATPPYLHLDQILQVLAAGKHVVCEKPLVASLQAADQVLAAEAAAGKRVMPIFNYRFGNGLQKLKLLVDSGLAGRAYLTTIETAWRRRAEYYAVPWRGKWATELGGTLIAHAIHAHDLLTYVLGPAKSVFARTATRVHSHIEVEDTAVVSVEMCDGSFASLSVTIGSSAQISRHRFCFENLSAESNTRPYSNTGDPWVFTPDTPEVGEQIEAKLAEYTPLPEDLDGQYYRFHQALATGGRLPVTVQDARDSLEFNTAIYASARSGCAITLPIGQDHPMVAGWAPA